MPNLATWFTPSLQTISRSSGRSSVLAAAYRACIELTDERLGITRDFTPKGRHGLAENICIGIPNNDIGKLFNDAEKAETRINSTVARELMVPLPSAWADVERAQCARGIGEMLRAKYGVAVLVSIHRPNKDNNNDHAHILFTTRTVDEEGNFGKKTRILDDAKTGEIKKLREAACEIVNAQAKAQGDDWYVYAGKFSDILEDHIPTTHISIKAGRNQKALIEANKDSVKEARAELEKIKREEKSIDGKIAALQTQQANAESSHNAAPTLAKANEGVTVSKPSDPPLKRLAMPEDAEKARKQIENAIYLKADKRKQFDEWTSFQTELLKNAPKPEYNFFGRPSKRYKTALNEHDQQLQSIIEAIEDCNKKALELNAYMHDPERKRLANVYRETIAHNERVKAYEMQVSEENTRRAQLQHQREQAVNSIDWVAYMQKSEREVTATRKHEMATGYDSGGYGM